MNRNRLFAAALIACSGCATGPRQEMFDYAAGGSPATIPIDADPFLEVPSLQAPSVQSPALPKLGAVSSAARLHMWQAATKLKGPVPKSLPSSIPVDKQKIQAQEAIGLSAIDKKVHATQTGDTTVLKGDGVRGFVQLMPPPPEDMPNGVITRDARYFEMPPAPEN